MMFQYIPQFFKDYVFASILVHFCHFVYLTVFLFPNIYFVPVHPLQTNQLVIFFESLVLEFKRICNLYCFKTYPDFIKTGVSNIKTYFLFPPS